MSTLIEAIDLEIAYGDVAACQDISFKVEENEIVTFGTVPSYLTLPNFDFTPYVDTPLTISVWMKTTQTTQFTLFVLTGTAVFQLRITPSSGNRVFFQYGGNLTIDFSAIENNNTFNLADGNFNLITIVFGNISTFKLYLNGILVQEVINTVTNLTGIKTPFFWM